MKLSLVAPLVTALVGFSLGWLAKPACSQAVPKPPLPAAPLTPTPTTAQPPPAATPPAQPAATRPAAAAAVTNENITTAKNAAKMLRFAEAVGLSDSQQAQLAQLIAESRQAAAPGQAGKPVKAGEILDQFTASAAILEKGLADLLTPQQRADFDALRKRERDNRAETGAQRELADLSEVTDLSADQRAKVLAGLRNAAAEEADVPDSLALVLDSSVLPLGPLAPSAQSIQTLRQLADGQPPEDPATLHAKLIENQRRQLDARLAVLKDILSPAQLAQYRATVAEQYAIHDRMRPAHW